MNTEISTPAAVSWPSGHADKPSHNQRYLLDVTWHPASVALLLTWLHTGPLDHPQEALALTHPGNNHAWPDLYPALLRPLLLMTREGNKMETQGRNLTRRFPLGGPAGCAQLKYPSPCAAGPAANAEEGQREAGSAGLALLSAARASGLRRTHHGASPASGTATSNATRTAAALHVYTRKHI